MARRLQGIGDLLLYFLSGQILGPIARSRLFTDVGLYFSLFLVSAHFGGRCATNQGTQWALVPAVLCAEGAG